MGNLRQSFTQEEWRNLSSDKKSEDEKSELRSHLKNNIDDQLQILKNLLDLKQDYIAILEDKISFQENHISELNKIINSLLNSTK